MKIGIDIDDTITNTYVSMLAVVADEYNVDFESLLVDKPSYLELRKMFPNFGEFARRRFCEVALNATLKSDVVKYLKKLKELGHELIFITARSYEEYENPYDLTYNYLKKYDIPFDKLIVDIKNKGQECLNEVINLFIDDDDYNCQSVKSVNVSCLQFHICFSDGVEGVKKVYSWKEIYEYVVSLESEVLV